MSISCVNRFIRFLVIPTLVLVLLSGCQNHLDTTMFNSLAKSDVDTMADVSLQEMNRLLEKLLFKLYKRNPGELDKVQGMTVERRHDLVFDNKGRLIFSEIDKKQGTEALNLAFDVDYRGDRIFALMCGLIGVVRSSYNWKTEQFMFDSLEAQELFDSARNIEILAWRLSHTRDDNGDLLLLTNSQPGEDENLSYERLFGKMISIQDMMSFVVAGKWERGLSGAIKQAVFLPMGL